MSIVIGILKETYPGERRVALTPSSLDPLTKAGCEFVMQPGAGDAAGFPDADFAAKGVQLLPTRADVIAAAGIIPQVRTLGANPEYGIGDLALFRNGQIVLGFAEPLTALAQAQALATAGVTSFAMEMVPRITRAQSMDALSSMATIAGYKAVLIAADSLPRMFPMLMTAAGTVKPAKAFVLGAGVAGLQAIATAKRLGAVVSAYDVRPAVKEQVESLGGKFVHMDLDAGGSEDKGGYAKALGEDFYRRQRELLLSVIRDQDVVISTAAVPGKKAPILITAEMVRAMAPGSVIVDLAAERGGNCELTVPGQTIDVHGVSVMGPLNVPTMIPYHASQMYGKNVANFIKNMIRDKAVHLDMQDEIIRDAMITRDGEIVNSRVKELAGQSQITSAEPTSAQPTPAAAGGAK